MEPESTPTPAEPPVPDPARRSGRIEARLRRRRRRTGVLAALATLVAAVGVVAVSQAGDTPARATSAADVGQRLLAPTTPPEPVSVETAPAPVEVSSSSTTTTAAPTTTTAAARRTPVAAPRPITALAPALPVPPLTLDAALAEALSGRAGCLVVEDEGRTIFERDGGSGFVPASSQKVLVAAAALSRLGPDFRFETTVLAARPPQDGRLDEAWLVGGGDPYLTTPEYATYLAGRVRTAGLPVTPMTTLADALVAAGVRGVPGGLHTDDTRHDRQRSVPSWKPSYVSEAEVGSLGALTVNEGLAAWGPSQAVAPDPALAAANGLGKLLGDRGVTLAAPTSGGTAPSGAVVVASVLSAPLSEIVAGMLRASDNYVAETLVRELDRAFGGAGATAGGTARVVEEIGRLGVPVDGVQLADGSGLDRGNRATCRALLGAISLSSSPRLSVLDSGLAIAGRTGTLAKRYVGTPAEIRLAAKTGWINGAVAMVGRIAGQPTRRFALIVNGPFGWPVAEAIEDRVVALLAAGVAPG